MTCLARSSERTTTVVGSSAKYTCDGRENGYVGGRPNSRALCRAAADEINGLDDTLLPVLAAEKSAKTIIVVLPYKFLMEYHLIGSFNRVEETLTSAL
jgi:hypothetical protein